MALTFGPNLGLLADGALGEEHYEELMAMWRGLDSLIQARVVDKDLTAPPGAPVDGACYIVAGVATGAWVGQENKLARWSTKAAAGVGAWEFYAPMTGWQVYVTDEARTYRFGGATWGRRVEELISIPVAVSDETTPLSAGNGKVTFHMPFDFTLNEVFAGLTTVQAGSGAGGIVTVDVNEAGASILSTKITIDNGEETSLTAAIPPVFSDTELAKGAKVTIDIDQIGDGSAKGLKVYLNGWRK
jgi:hypothetical protein